MIIRPFPDPAHRTRWAACREAMENSRHVRHTPDGVQGDRLAMTIRAAAPAVRLGLRSLGLLARGIANAYAMRRADHTVKVRGLPAAFNGYRILQVSDLHIDALPGLSNALLVAVRDVACDLLVITGDFLAGDRRAIDDMGVLAPVRAMLNAVRARDGALAVLGNHDFAALVPTLETLGLHVLVNEHVRVERNGERIGVIGLDDVHCYYTPAAAAALHLAPSVPSIALVHSPEFAGEAAAAGCGLYLCGHTHGGQVCLPGGYPVVRSLYRNHALYSGRWCLGDMEGLTSRGIGVSDDVPVRFQCPPEIHLITLAC